MRFYAHDGKSTHGPAGIEELLKLPGFDGDTLVCPVGSDDTNDWKPALAYAPFKRALLESATSSLSPLTPVQLPKAGQPSMLALLPIGSSPSLAPLAPIDPPKAPVPLAPAPPPAAKTVPCPRCAHANLEEARFCNKCGASMTATVQDISPAAPIEPPKPPAALEPQKPPVPILPKPPLPPEPPKTPAPFELTKTPSPIDSPRPPSPFNSPQPPSPFDSPKEPEAPASDPFAHLDPMLNFPAEPAPMSLPESPRRPLQPGKMGQLGAIEEAPSTAPFSSPSPALAPEPAPDAAALPVWKRPAVLAAFAIAALVVAGLGYVMLHRRAPAASVAELTPMPAPLDSATANPAPAEPPQTNQIYSTPPPTSSPAIPDPRARRAKKKSPKIGMPPASVPAVAAAKPKRARKPRPSRSPKPATSMAEAKPQGKAAAKTADGEKDPLLEALLTDATQPGAEKAAEPAAESAAKTGMKPAPPAGPRPAAKPGQFSLPGLQRPVSASDRAAAPQARAPRPVNEEAAPVKIAGLDAPSLAEPGKSPPPAGIEDEPAKSAEGDQLALVQVHEQFDFCAQLLAQGAFGDHYDTCLCKDAREAAPYRGRRGAYVSSMKKEANSGRLDTSAKILSSKIDAGVAKVTARWKGSADKGRDATQTWKLEDGLWCQAP